MLALLLAGCASVPPTGLVFGVLGDTPYNSAEVQRLDALIDDMNQERLDFVVHVGDIGGGRLACSDAWLAARKRQFARLKHKFVLIRETTSGSTARTRRGGSPPGARFSARRRSPSRCKRANTASTCAGRWAGRSSSR